MTSRHRSTLARLLRLAADRLEPPATILDRARQESRARHPSTTGEPPRPRPQVVHDSGDRPARPPHAPAPGYPWGHAR